MKRLIPFLAIAAIAVAAAVVFLRPDAASPPDIQLGASSGDTVADVSELGITEMTLGDPSAPITVVEYASYTCPHCRRFHEGAFKELKAEYIDSGKVHFIYREVYFDRFGLWASILARCAGPERFFGMNDLIYGQQTTWTQGEPSDIVAALRRIGLTAGMTDEQIDVCFNDAEKAENLVAWYQANAEADNVRSTPSFVVDGEPQGNMSIDAWRRLLDAKL